MTTGEFDFDDNFIERKVFFPFLYAFWLLFIIVMPVLFNNLLVSYCKANKNMEILVCLGGFSCWRYRRRIAKGKPY